MSYANQQTYNNHVDILGLPIDNITLNEAADKVLDPEHGFSSISFQQNKPHVYYFVNANSINACCKTPKLTEVLLRADSLFADGIGMRIAAKKCGKALIDNVNGTDLLPILCKKSVPKGKRIFLFGAKPGIAKKAAKNLNRKYQGLQVVGSHHGYVNEEGMSSVIQLINDTKPDIVLVAMGTPIQEFWVDKYASELNCEAVMAVGGLFDFYSGAIPRAPQFMRKHGLEWLYRLIQEPVTKFERYVLGVPEFLFHVYLENKRFTGVE